MDNPTQQEVVVEQQPLDQILTVEMEQEAHLILQEEKQAVV
jgi:hypothetical protein